MGAGRSSALPMQEFLQETRIFATWTLADVKELAKRFRNQVFGFALVEAQFESIISFKESVSKHVNLSDLFDTLDNDNDGRIDGLELLAGLALCCQAEFEEKARFCFELFDFNLNATLSKKEMVVMMMAAICGMNLLTGGGEDQEPDLETFEKLATMAFLRADKDKSGTISYEEFVTWARSNREMMGALEKLSAVAEDAKKDVDTVDSAESASEGELSDVEFPDFYATKNRSDRTKKSVFNPHGDGGEYDARDGGDDFQAIVQWKGQVHEPTNYVSTRWWKDGPDSNLELEWVHGVRAQNSRGNVRYVVDEASPDEVTALVYPAARLGVVYNMNDRSQVCYQGHCAEITCLAMHPSGRIVATGDKRAHIHIWDAITLECLGTIQGMVKQGVQHIVFAPNGERIATVGLDIDRTISVYDTSTGDVISSSKGLSSPNNVFDIAYSVSGLEICIVGKAEVRFFRNLRSSQRAMHAVQGKIGRMGKKQTFFCVAYFNEDAIVGCASGEIYKFSAGRCVQVVQAHGIGDPVLSINFNAVECSLVTGGKDGMVKTWTANLKEVGTALDLSEDLDGDGKADNGGLDIAATSVHIIGNRILVGTKGSDIFEAIMPATPNDRLILNRLAWGHSKGELWGLATHPSRDEFATTGDDKTLRLWSIRSHEMLHLRLLPQPSRAVAYNQMGNLLSVGLQDGSMAVLYSSNLRVISSWKHCEEPITDVKFSPNGQYLLGASEDGNIYVYRSDDRVKFVRQAVCRGHSGAVLHVDFSLDSRYIQSNATDCSLYYWELSGNQIKASSTMRDVEWATWTCTLGWPVQGVYPLNAEITDVNACHAVPEAGVLVTGDDFGVVNLFRYPSLDPGALRQTHTGHAGNVCCVRFTYNRRHVVSVGGSDCAVLVWKHELEEVESSDDEESEGAYAAPPESYQNDPSVDLNYAHEVGDVGDRTPLQEAVNRQQSTQELVELVKQLRPEESTIVRPWKGSIVEPTRWKEKMMAENPHQTVDGATDVDLELNWIHGYRCHDCRNNIRYNAAGDIIYFAATVGVVLSKPTGKQRFLQGAHTDDIIGMAAHPAGQIFATGEAGRNPAIIIWNAESMHTLSRLSGSHQRGVPLMAFNSTGKYLASVGLDSEYSLAVHEWKNGSLVMKTPTSKERVLCICFLTPDHAFNSQASARELIVTGGVGHLKFWWWRGQNSKSQKCQWGSYKKKVGKEITYPDVLCVESASPDVCVAGTADGRMLIVKGFRCVGSADMGHAKKRSPVQCLWCRKSRLDESTPVIYISGDRDGNVIVWEMRQSGHAEQLMLNMLHCFNASDIEVKLAANSSSSIRPKNASIRSVCERDGVLLIGTQGSEIYEMPYVVEKGVIGAEEFQEMSVSVLVNDSSLLISGHGMGEVWGLTSHPTKPLYFTSGDDGTIRCWTLDGHRMIHREDLDNEKSRAISLHPVLPYIAVACNSGKLIIFKYELVSDRNTLSIAKFVVTDMFQDSQKTVQTVKYSFEGSLLAMGSNDSDIYLYSVDNTGKHTFMTKCSGRTHTAAVIHIDFGAQLKENEVLDSRGQAYNRITGKTRDLDQNDIVLQSNCAKYALKFWRSDGTHIEFASAVRDVCWATFTCTLGWPVQGIWPPESDGAEIHAATRSNSWRDVPVLATADDFGRIRLFNYPATRPGAPDKCYHGHSKDVRNIGFSYNDEFCISTGGEDRCVFLWSTDVLEELRERQALAMEQKAFKVRSVNKGKIQQLGTVLEEDVIVEAFCGEEADPLDDTDTFDDSIAIRGNRRVGHRDENIASKPWKGAVREPSTWQEPPNCGDVPDAALELNYVYGYRGWDCRNNIGFADSTDEVVYHVAGVGIVLSMEHNIQVHNTEHTDDILCLDVHPAGHTVATGEIGNKPKIVLWDANTGVTLRSILFHQRGISSVRFTGDGSHIVSVGMDTDGIVAVHNCSTGVITGSGKVGRGVSVYVVAVCGTKTFLTGGKMHVKFWDISNNTGGRKELSSKGGLFGKHATSKCVISAAYLGTDAVTGMADGTLLLWKDRSNTKVEIAHEGAVTALTSLPPSNSGASTGSGDTGPRVISGGKDGCIYLWNIQLIRMWSMDLKLSTPTSIIPQVQALAFKDGKLLLGTKAAEIYFVNMLSNETKRVVCGHHQERSEVWGLATHPFKPLFATVGDDCTVRIWDCKTRDMKHICEINNKGRAATFNPDGQLAIGLYDGKVLVLSEDLDCEFINTSVATEWIRAMAYSPNGHTLAVGSHDSNIYVLETKNYSVKYICRDHPLSVTQLDFSTCSKVLQSVSEACDLLFWNVETGERIQSPTSVRDKAWHRWTCLLGWPTQGIWLEDAKGTDFNTVDRSPDSQLLVTGDDFKLIKLYRYPCVRAHSRWKEYKGHSAHIQSVKFHHNSAWVFSVGGFDKAVMQFAVKNG